MPHLVSLQLRAPALIDRILALLTRLFNSETTLKLHSPALSLLRLLSPFERPQALEQVALLCLLSKGTKAADELSQVRLEGIGLAKTVDHRVCLLTKGLLQGLVDCLGDGNAEVRMEALKLICEKMVPFSDGLFTGQIVLETFSDPPLFPILVEKLLTLLDDPSEEVRLMTTLPLLIILKSMPVTPDDSQLLL